MKIKKTLLKPVNLLVITIFLQSFSLLSIKFSTLESGVLSFMLLVTAFGFVGLRAILCQRLLKLSDLSYIYPFAALVQVLILIYAVVLFGEEVTVFNLSGFFLMLSGSYFMSR